MLELNLNYSDFIKTYWKMCDRTGKIFAYKL